MDCERPITRSSGSRGRAKLESSQRYLSLFTKPSTHPCFVLTTLRCEYDESACLLFSRLLSVRACGAVPAHDTMLRRSIRFVASEVPDSDAVVVRQGKGTSCRVVLNGHPGSLQWFDVLADEVGWHGTLEVVPFNHIGRFAGRPPATDRNQSEPQNSSVVGRDGNGSDQSTNTKSMGGASVGSNRSQAAAPLPLVTCATFCASGSVLVTIDSWFHDLSFQKSLNVHPLPIAPW